MRYSPGSRQVLIWQVEKKFQVSGSKSHPDRHATWNLKPEIYILHSPYAGTLIYLEKEKGALIYKKNRGTLIL